MLREIKYLSITLSLLSLIACGGKLSDKITPPAGIPPAENPPTTVETPPSTVNTSTFDESMVGTWALSIDNGTTEKMSLTITAENDCSLIINPSSENLSYELPTVNCQTVNNTVTVSGDVLVIKTSSQTFRPSQQEVTQFTESYTLALTFTDGKPSGTLSITKSNDNAETTTTINVVLYEGGSEIITDLPTETNEVTQPTSIRPTSEHTVSIETVKNKAYQLMHTPD